MLGVASARPSQKTSVSDFAAAPRRALASVSQPQAPAALDWRVLFTNISENLSPLFSSADPESENGCRCFHCCYRGARRVRARPAARGAAPRACGACRNRLDGWRGATLCRLWDGGLAPCAVRSSADSRALLISLIQRSSHASEPHC